VYPSSWDWTAAFQRNKFDPSSEKSPGPDGRRVQGHVLQNVLGSNKNRHCETFAAGILQFSMMLT
jgi:hypothetical protein